MIEELAEFTNVSRCKIGSPFVIAQMFAARAQQADAKVVGFEANGGFLLGFDATGPHGPLPALMTRDAFLPLIAPLAAARANGITYNRLIQGLKAAGVEVDRKNLAEIAVSDPAAFTALVEVARAALPADVNAPSGEAA